MIEVTFKTKIIEITFQTKIPEGAFCSILYHDAATGCALADPCKHLEDGMCDLHDVALEGADNGQCFKCSACLALVEASK